MKEFNWKIIEVNQQSGTMVVQYTHNQHVSAYNIPIPQSGEDISAQVKLYAPKADWERANQQLVEVEAGMEGTSILDETVEQQNEMPMVVGNWQEEYLRALIYQILEEIRESQV